MQVWIQTVWAWLYALMLPPPPPKRPWRNCDCPDCTEAEATSARINRNVRVSATTFQGPAAKGIRSRSRHEQGLDAIVRAHRQLH